MSLSYQQPRHLVLLTWKNVLTKFRIKLNIHNKDTITALTTLKLIPFLLFGCRIKLLFAFI
eukprot:snap_masked-scaffold_14-processed-gene-4.33-mRNA-1 protein AED:1.00 eAED:1.00 QI:0/0/0/0/1/1/2/0/60